MTKIRSITVRCLAILMIAICCVSCTKSAETLWQEQYDLGIHYLESGDYEQAILAFEAAIEIDPKRPEAYLEAAHTYVALDEIEAAVAILEQGYAATNEEFLQIEKNQIILSDMEDPDNVEGIEDNDAKSIQDDQVQDVSAIPTHITMTETRNFYAYPGKRIIVIEFETGPEWLDAMSVLNYLSRSVSDEIISPEGFHPISAVVQDDGELIYEMEWVYDDAGYCVQEIVNRKSASITTFINDASGKPVAWEETDGDGNGRRGAFVYDADGNLIEKTVDGFSDSFYSHVFIRNSLGQIEYYKEAYGDFSNQFRYEYDSQGRMVKQVIESINADTQFYYDEKNCLAERSCFINNQLVNQSQYQYVYE